MYAWSMNDIWTLYLSCFACKNETNTCFLKNIRLIIIYQTIYQTRFECLTNKICPQVLMTLYQSIKLYLKQSHLFKTKSY